MSRRAPQLTAKRIAVLKILTRHRGAEYPVTCAEIGAKSVPHGTPSGFREWACSGSLSHLKETPRRSEAENATGRRRGQPAVQ